MLINLYHLPFSVILLGCLKGMFNFSLNDTSDLRTTQPSRFKSPIITYDLCTSVVTFVVLRSISGHAVVFVPYRLFLQIEHVSTVQNYSGKLFQFVLFQCCNLFQPQKKCLCFDDKLHFQYIMMDFHNEQFKIGRQ